LLDNTSEIADELGGNRVPPLGVRGHLLRVPDLVYRTFATLLLIGGCFGQIALILTRNLLGVQPAWCTVLATLALACGGLLYIGLVPAHIGFHFLGDLLARRVPGFALLRALVIGVILIELARVGVDGARIQKGFGARFSSFDFPVWIAMLVIPVAAVSAAIRVVVLAVMHERALLRLRRDC
jgi:hypothetical protein